MSASAHEDARATQRALFVQTRQLWERGQEQAAAANMPALRDYPLYPYLQLQQIRAALARGDESDIEEFLTQNEGSVVGEQLRNQWLAILADRTQWSRYLKYYRANNAGNFQPSYFQPSKQQQCWYIEALHQTGQAEASLQEIDKLWLTVDMPDACDEAYKRWLASDKRNDALIWKRLLLAIDRKQESLARFLAVQIGPAYKLQADYALMFARNPAALNDLLPQVIQQPEASSTIAVALKNLARNNLDATQTLWQQTKAANYLARDDSDAIRKEIGRQQIIKNGGDALPWLLQYDPNGEDSYLLEWRVRLGLRHGDWANIEKWIAAMPADMAQTSRWNYWRARALLHSDDVQKQQQAKAIFSALAKERSFYGFLAADQQQAAYQLNNEPIVAASDSDNVAKRPAVLRAREFLLLNEYANARREWQSAIRAMSATEQQIAALIAERWNWYDQGIRTAAASGGLNDLRLRFPIGYRDSMELAAKKTALPLHWLFAITRQESAFMPDARSPVGALGLMQLMPDTAKHVARGERIKVSADQLLKPETNIRLGSIYLRDMAQRYNGNRILATAAYNAGPNRISSLLREQTETLSADVWIELLPYRETREYVQSVLTFAVIYSQRLGQPAPLLTQAEREIPAPNLQANRGP
ncbi:MAG: transglycosylase SLT domain-containing protein [Spongiibacteraceae bacterium]